MKIDDLYEARRNPEMNTKRDIYDILLEYAEDDNAFLHTSSVGKVGINPRTAMRSSDDTPAGIYAFHLKTIKPYLEQGRDSNMSLGQSLPFYGGNHLFILRANDGYTDTLQSYTQGDLEADIDTLKGLYGADTINAYRGFADTNENYVNAPIGIIWAITKTIAIGGTSELSHQQYPDPMKWNSVLRKLGFKALHDKGYGWIHAAESTQSLFLDGTSYEVIDHHIINRKQTTTKIDGKEYVGGRLPKVLNLTSLDDTELTNIDRNQYTSKVQQINIRRINRPSSIRQLRSLFPKAKIVVQEYIAQDATPTIPEGIHIEALVFSQEFPYLPSQIRHLETIHHSVDTIKYSEHSIPPYIRERGEPKKEKYSPELFAKIMPYS